MKIVLTTSTRMGKPISRWCLLKPRQASRRNSSWHLSPAEAQKYTKRCVSTTLHFDQTLIRVQMNTRLFMTLLCMSFLWIGSQIPLFLFGSVLPLIYQEIGGVDRYIWFIIGYLIPNAALCPFVGALSDLFGRQKVAIVGQMALIIGPIITATANTMNIAIGKYRPFT